MKILIRVVSEDEEGGCLCLMTEKEHARVKKLFLEGMEDMEYPEDVNDILDSTELKFGTTVTEPFVFIKASISTMGDGWGYYEEDNSKEPLMDSINIPSLKTTWLDEKNVSLRFDRYRNGRTCLSLVSEYGEPLMVATVNLPDVAVPKDCVLIKDYSENEGLLKVLIDNKIVSDTSIRIPSGFVSIPMCKLLVESPLEKACKVLGI